MKKRFTATLLATATTLLISGCATQDLSPRRVDTGGPGSVTTTGLDMRDLMDAAMGATRELLTAPVLTQFEARNGRLPRLDVGVIRNNTRDRRITIAQVSERIMEELLASGQITLVANDAAAVATAQLDSFLNDSKIDLKDQADFYLEGEIFGQAAVAGRLVENNYSFMLRLNDRNRSQVWKRTIDITKQGGW